MPPWQAFFLPARSPLLRADVTTTAMFATRCRPAPTDPAKDAALIVDGATGKVLYSRNATAERHPASLTKMMTLYLLFDALKKGQMSFSSMLPVSAHAAAQKPTKLHLYAGDQIPVEVAIKAIVVRSANDVAVTIAEALGGTESNFAEMMNAKARQLGMRDTFYHNASGLPDPLQISTASDLAVLARHLAYDFPQYFHYFSAPGFTYRGVSYTTHDNLIGRYHGRRRNQDRIHRRVGLQSRLVGHARQDARHRRRDGRTHRASPGRGDDGAARRRFRTNPAKPDSRRERESSMADDGAEYAADHRGLRSDAAAGAPDDGRCRRGR